MLRPQWGGGASEAYCLLVRRPFLVATNRLIRNASSSPGWQTIHRDVQRHIGHPEDSRAVESEIRLQGARQHLHSQAELRKGSGRSRHILQGSNGRRARAAVWPSRRQRGSRVISAACRSTRHPKYNQTSPCLPFRRPRRLVGKATRTQTGHSPRCIGPGGSCRRMRSTRRGWPSLRRVVVQSEHVGVGHL